MFGVFWPLSSCLKYCGNELFGEAEGHSLLVLFKKRLNKELSVVILMLILPQNRRKDWTGDSRGF